MNTNRLIYPLVMTSILVHCVSCGQAQYADHIQVVLDNTKILEYDRGDRLPLILWPLINPGKLSAEQAEKLSSDLDDRGLALLARWTKENREEALEQALIIGRAQKELGLRTYVNAIDLLYSFYNGNERTAHIDKEGKIFWDDGFGGKSNMGCPFAIDFRKEEIRDRVEYYLDRYIENGIGLDFIFVDWEVDGPLEVNTSYETSMQCSRCIENLGANVKYDVFQEKMRQMRSYFQYYCLSEPVLSRFPEALVGNYAVYPNDGYRYWYDYFEFYADGQPCIQDQGAKYRKWYNDFPLTGFTYAMPVSYTWSRIFHWYDFQNKDYRWFYNMLLVASNAGKSTPRKIPVISWVHWHTIFHPDEPDPSVEQMSEAAYQELLWHMLLRGTNSLAMWCNPEENAKEVRLIHEVYADAQKYGDFLDKGVPINFALPSQPGSVVSGLILNDKVLVRRTDFGNNRKPITIMAGARQINIPYAPGQCQVISLK